MAGFDSFTIEPVFIPPQICDTAETKNAETKNADITDRKNTDTKLIDRKNSELRNVENIELDEIRLFRVDITFRNNKGTAQVCKISHHK